MTFQYPILIYSVFLSSNNTPLLCPRFHSHLPRLLIDYLYVDVDCSTCSALVLYCIASRKIVNAVINLPQSLSSSFRACRYATVRWAGVRSVYLLQQVSRRHLSLYPSILTHFSEWSRVTCQYINKDYLWSLVLYCAVGLHVVRFCTRGYYVILENNVNIMFNFFCPL
jgi:hypothetical protein